MCTPNGETALTPQQHARAAFEHDRRGQEADAVSHYEAALKGHLPADLRRECLLGLGSTLRSLGRYREAFDVLDNGRREFGEAGEFTVFLAMVAYNLQRHHEAVSLLLTALVEYTDDPAIAGYAAAIRQYAQDLDRTW